MASHDEPAGSINGELLEAMQRHGGVAALAADLLAQGFAPDGRWEPATLDRYLRGLGHWTALSASEDVLRVAVDEPDLGTASLALIEATLDTYSNRDCGPLQAWAVTHRDWQ